MKPIKLERVYILDIQDFDKKWFDFFKDYIHDQFYNGSIHDLYWDEWAWIDHFDLSVTENMERYEKEVEFKKIVEEAGMPSGAQVYLKFWW